MSNIQIVELETLQGTEVGVIIDNGDGSFTSMSKAHYDELEAAKDQSGTL